MSSPRVINLLGLSFWVLQTCKYSVEVLQASHMLWFKVCWLIPSETLYDLSLLNQAIIDGGNGDFQFEDTVGMIS